MITSEKPFKPLIAVVDDDQSVRRAIGRFLAASGFRAMIFESAEIFLADEHHSRFDCLIVDLQLSGMSGVDLKDRLRSEGVHTPFILMTGRDGREFDQARFAARNAAMLHKSAPGEILLTTVRRMTAMRAAETQAATSQ